MILHTLIFLISKVKRIYDQINENYIKVSITRAALPQVTLEGLTEAS
jgi:hypothetical protein